MIPETFYMCYVQGKRSPVFIHATRESAEREAERLARLPDNAGYKVWVLKSLEYCEVATVNWHMPNESICTGGAGESVFLSHFPPPYGV